MNTFKPTGTELAKVLFSGNNDFKRVHYFAGVYIVELSKTVDKNISTSDIKTLLDGLAGCYPSLRNKDVRYVLDDEILIVLDTTDINLTILREEHFEQYSDIDLGVLVNNDTLKDINFEQLVDYTPTSVSDGVLVRVGGATREVDYTNYTLCYSKKYDLYTVTIQGGVVIDFMPTV